MIGWWSPHILDLIIYDTGPHTNTQHCSESQHPCVFFFISVSTIVMFCCGKDQSELCQVLWIPTMKIWNYLIQFDQSVYYSFPFCETRSRYVIQNRIEFQLILSLTPILRLCFYFALLWLRLGTALSRQMLTWQYWLWRNNLTLLNKPAITTHLLHTNHNSLL